jgi:ornithine carbamoyltransferase
MRHLLSLADLSPEEIHQVLLSARMWKRHRKEWQTTKRPLEGETWALLFSKSSTRTRVSFEVGLCEMGAQTLFLSASEIQMGRGEPIIDTARVLGRMIHGAVIRTHAHADVESFAQASGIITINALTDDEHPCQILADLLTWEELRGPIRGHRVTFIGDAACNVARSWMLAARLLSFDLILAAPRAYWPSQTEKNCTLTEDVFQAAEGAHLLYTDVWVSMGLENEKQQRLRDFQGYQINEALLDVANPDALVMHCLPAYRGWEITDEAFEAHSATIFQQAENRLHIQKAIVEFLTQWR